MAYSYKRTITIDHTKVGGDLINFPVLISISDTTFKTVSNGGHVESTFGYDINFYSDSGGTSLLTWNNESYDPATGDYIAWVKIPALSSSVNTVIYVFYGDPTINTPQTSPTQVWDSNFKGVWHLQTIGGILIPLDATSNGRDGTENNTPTPVTGKIDGAANFVLASSQSITASNFSVSSAYTWSGWFKSPSASDALSVQQPFIAALTSDSYGFSWSHSSGTFQKAAFHRNSGGSYFASKLTSALNANTWYYIVGVWTGSSLDIYLNGTSENSTLIPSINTVSGSMSVGGKAGGYFSGDIDEIRVSDVARSGNWILTEYNNQNSPSTFYSLGSENPVTVGSDNNRRLLLKV